MLPFQNAVDELVEMKKLLLLHVSVQKPRTNWLKILHKEFF